ncbi:MAG: hypothetical protein IKV66_13960 [Clostridia bacterium]|nr:hypothetical protein [Clostridia bacterium]
MKATVMKMSTLLLALLTVAGLAACADNADTNTDVTTDIGTETQAPQETEEVRYPCPEPIDLNGYELRIASWDPYTKYTTADSLTGDVINDALYYADLAVKETYNCKITNVMSDAFQTVTEAVRTAVLAGDNVYDLSFNHDCQTVSNALKNCFVDLRSCDVFDFDAPWWTKTKETFTVDNRMYFASSYVTYSPIYQSMVLCYNKDLAENLDIDIPYEEIFAGNWYLEDMISMVQNANADLNGDGKIVLGEDRTGFLTNTLGLACVQFCLDGTVLEQDEDGYLKLNVDAARLQKMSEQVERLMEYGAETPDNHYGTEYFANEQGLFNLTQIDKIPTMLRDKNIRVGALPFPKLDESQQDYITSTLDLYWAIPATAVNEVDTIATILEAKAQKCYYEVLPVSFETALQTKFADAPEDAKTYEIIRDTMIIDAGYAYNSQDSGIAGMIRLFSRTTSGTLSSFLEQNRKSAEKAIEKINETYQKMSDLG